MQIRIHDFNGSLSKLMDVIFFYQFLDAGLSNLCEWKGPR